MTCHHCCDRGYFKLQDGKAPCPMCNPAEYRRTRTIDTLLERRRRQWPGTGHPHPKDPEGNKTILAPSSRNAGAS